MEVKKIRVREGFVKSIKEWLPTDKVKTKEKEWMRFKNSLIEADEEICERISGWK